MNQKAYNIHHFLFDVLDVYFASADTPQKKDRISFIFTKDKGHLVDQVAERLQAERRATQIEKGVHALGSKSTEVAVQVIGSAQLAFQSGKEVVDRTKVVLQPKVQEAAGLLQQNLTHGKNALMDGVNQNLEALDSAREKSTTVLSRGVANIKEGSLSIFKHLRSRVKPGSTDCPHSEQPDEDLSGNSEEPSIDQD